MLEKIIITDRNINIPLPETYDNALYIQNDNSTEIPKGYSEPDLNYREIEENAYKNAINDIEQFYNKHKGLFFSVSLKKALTKHMLHIYGYYYRQSKIINTAEKYGNGAIIYSNNIEQSEFPNMRIINDYSTGKLKIKLLKKLVRHVLSPLFHKKNRRISRNVLVKINSLSQFEIFEYLFPQLTAKDYSVLISAPASLPRVNAFMEYMENIHIDWAYYMNNSFISVYNTLSRLFIPILNISTYKEYLLYYYMIEDYYMYDSYNNMLKQNTELKMLIMSDEFNASADILSELCKQNGIECINYQHGGIYLADHNYGRFIVFSTWVKNYYSRKTHSNPNQIYVLGHPQQSKQKTFTVSNNKNLRVIMLGQYLFGYMNKRRKEDMLMALKEIAEDSNIDVSFKDHPGSSDGIADDLLANSYVEIIDQQKMIDLSHYDLSISFYSTTLIESVLSGTPALSLNISHIRGIPLLENSGVLQVYSAEELKKLILRIMKNRTVLRELFEEEKRSMNEYWNIIEADRATINTIINKIINETDSNNH